MVKVIVNNLPAQDLEIMGLIPLADKGKPGGVAELGADGKVPAEQLPPIAGETATEAIAFHKAESEPHAQYALGLELDSHIASTNNPHQVTRSQLGAEPIGAEERAKAYAEQLIAEIPPAPLPTLEQIGAEPAGAAPKVIAAHKAEIEPHPQYALGLELDSHINSTNNPHQVTRAQLGAEPIGAEERAKSYADQLFAALKTRSPNPPSNPSEGHIWEQVDIASNSVMHTWIRQNALWRSHSMNVRHNFFWISSATDDLVTKRNWEIEIYPNMPFAVSKILISYLQIGLTAYGTIQDANNYWAFLLLGTNNSNVENYWTQLNFNGNIPTQTRAYKNIFVGADLALDTELRRLRLEARAVGNPGLALARANLGYVFSRS